VALAFRFVCFGCVIRTADAYRIDKSLSQRFSSSRVFPSPMMLGLIFIYHRSRMLQTLALMSIINPTLSGVEC
jgi:hypothetical protein